MRNVSRVVRGEPLYRPAFSAMTIDLDDIQIARTYLDNRQTWSDDSIVGQYEEAFATWNGSRHAFAFMAGRVALSAVIHALDFQPGDEVILPGYTCVVVPNAFEFAGVKTIYSDIELDTYGLDIGILESKVTPRTKAILLHHLYGLVCRDYEQIIEFARDRRIAVIEDCAHSTGAEYCGKKVGTRGDVAFYSSEQSKVFTTIQGGIAVTDNEKLARRLREYQQRAPSPSDLKTEKLLKSVALNYYLHKHPQRWWRGDIASLRFWDATLVSTTEAEVRGVCPVDYGQRMAAPLAAIGINQLSKIDRYNDERRRNAVRWDKWSESNGYKKPFVLPGSVPIYLRYPVLVEPGKKLNRQWALKELDVELGVWFVSQSIRQIERLMTAKTRLQQSSNA